LAASPPAEPAPARPRVHGRISFAPEPDAAVAAVQAMAVDVSRVYAGDCAQVELGVAEAVVNVVRHGYAGDGKAGSGGWVRLRWSATTNRVRVVVCDGGTPIPPGLLEQADETVFGFDETDLNAVPEGGMGLALVKHAFPQVRYRSRGGVNRLILQRRRR
jgi:serine/threonine-protein kinase RsbW